MESIQYVLDLILHIDRHLVEIAGAYQGWLYLVLFLIIFCETGLVVTPFLPGDSLLFAVGALAANPASGLHLALLLLLLCIAAILGDSVNYYLGTRLGSRFYLREANCGPAPGRQGRSRCQELVGQLPRELQAASHFLHR
ncbi:hypothetical protein [Pontibacter sp. SGAir0037]|uniref:hypothetical protein n=1 Tax=Pontibacter sp. SGAir0037 TaxID=2571030 RepID=UPI00197DF721|nr:hypothetical protein [Pontibacter sp. SGAir0037]